MATTITMPQLGETVTEGTVAQWLKKPGDAIEKYEAFVEVSTDKVNAEVPSPVSGVLREIICREGETVATGAPIAVIDEAGVAAAERASDEPVPGNVPVPAAAANVPAAAAGVPAAARDVPLAVPSSYGAAGDAPSRNRNGAGNGAANSADVLRGVSPAVRRLAREHRIDLARVTGTGTNGRITANDVVAAAGREGPASTVAAEVREPSPPPVAPAAVNAPAAANGRALPNAPDAPGRSTYTAPVPGTSIPLTQARKIIAKRMVESLAAAPHAWTMVEVDVSNVWAWRTREKDRFARDKGYPLTLLPFFIHAVVQAIKGQPLLNARFADDEIYVHREINVGIAVGLDGNLMVPVIRDADTLSIAGLAVAAGRIIDKARTGKLGADDLGGGTFTVNNTGANGSVLSKPIINGGQAGIVTMEAVVKRPVVVGDAIAIRSMMNVCLSLDHRVIDGTIANAFLGDLKRRLESMGPAGDL